MGMKDNILKHLSLALPNSRRRFRASIPVASAAICDLLDDNFASLPSARSAVLIFGAYPRTVRPLPMRHRPPIVRLIGRLVAEIKPRIFAAARVRAAQTVRTMRTVASSLAVFQRFVWSTRYALRPRLRWNCYEGFVNAKFFEEQRQEMVAAIRAIAEHIAAELGKTALDERVLKAMAKVPRHEFVPVEVQQYAYLNRPIPIGFDKTISQPLMVAVMTDLLELKPDDVVLEIGTGLGYQAAVLAELAGRVYSVEIIDELAQQAIRRLKQQCYTNVEVRIGNGYVGWPNHAPFDKVMVTAAPDLIPPPLINQLKAGGRMVIPVGLPGAQQLVVVERDLNGKVTTKEIMPVLFSVLEGPDESAFRAS
jgi:protein-L-isoaspartate(D-aspartate) O-methyltransferase